MKLVEILEQVGSIGVIPTTSAPSSTKQDLTGNVAALADPKIMAAQLALQKQQKEQAKQAILQQITNLNKQLADLNKSA